MKFSSFNEEKETIQNKHIKYRKILNLQLSILMIKLWHK